MPIPVSCQCGYQVDAPDQYAGKQVSCPACQNPLQVPLPQQAPIDAMLDEMLSDAGITAVTPGGYRCPNCTANIPGGAIICLECGYNVESSQMMGEDGQSEKKHFGAAVYTNRAYGHEQLDTAAEMMEVELLEKDAEGPTPYWVWLFMFFNVISFGMGLAVFSLTYFSLVESKTKPATIQIATYLGEVFRQLAEDAPRDKYFLVVTEAEITNKPQKTKEDDDEMGMGYTSKMAPGTYCRVFKTENGFSQITPLSGQNSTQNGWVPTMAVLPVTPVQVDLLQNLRTDPNVHTCFLNSNLTKYRFKTTEKREANNGKGYTVELGRNSKNQPWVELEYQYSKKDWDEDEARQHCAGHNSPFAPATETPVTDNAGFAFYTGLATFCIVQFWLGLIYYVVAHVSIALQAIKDEMVYAVLASVLPIYNVGWCFMRRKYVGGIGIMALLGIIMIIGGIVIQLIVPDLLPTVAGRTE